MVKIVSWNVNSIRVRLPHLIELDKTVKPRYSHASGNEIN